MALPIALQKRKTQLKRQVSKIRYRGIFDMAKLYKAMYNWCTEMEYEFSEKRYKHAWREGGAEVEIKWEAYKDINEFIRNNISVFIHIWDYKEVEVIKDGQKKKMATGRLFILFDGFVEYDAQGRWSDTKLKRLIRDFYLRHVVRKYMWDVWWDRLWYHANKLQQEAKKALEMESHSDVYDDVW